MHLRSSRCPLTVSPILYYLSSVFCPHSSVLLMSLVSPPFSEHFAPLAAAYDVVLSDVWGVVHNGVTAAPSACDALARFRTSGGTVVLITNAPRPGAVVAAG